MLKDKGCLISDIKDLDDIKHHGKDSFDYEKEKTPIYLIKELEIIDDLLTKIKAKLQVLSLLKLFPALFLDKYEEEYFCRQFPKGSVCL